MKLKQSKKLLQRSKKVIPGGNTFSKTELFGQGITPFALTHGKGSVVYDVDNNAYTDYILGLGCINLGYSFKPVDDAIKKQLDSGISFSLAHPLELTVAEKIIEMIPSAEMVRFGKNGSDVLSAAVKLARYITKKDHIISCGYHGWHDWVIANTSKPGGIPKNIARLSHKFEFNNINSLQKIINILDGDVSCVVMDLVSRYYPKPGFLEEVREITEKNNIVLIFDEIVTGFRMHNGGAQAYFNVIPDLSCFGKAIANGMPISALVGKKKYMGKLDEIFFTLTFAGETLSLAAANATLDFYLKNDVSKNIFKKGKILKDGMEKIIFEYELDDKICIEGMESRPILGFKNNVKNQSELTNYIVKYLCENNILSNISFFVNYSHTVKDIKVLIDKIGNLFERLPAIIKT